jgi:hypothetical protein
MGREPPESRWRDGGSLCRKTLEVPANRALPCRRVEDRGSPFVVCHAGGRGFESRRSSPRKVPAIGILRCLLRHTWRALWAAKGQHVQRPWRRKMPANRYVPSRHRVDGSPICACAALRRCRFRQHDLRREQRGLIASPARRSSCRFSPLHTSGSTSTASSWKTPVPSRPTRETGATAERRVTLPKSWAARDETDSLPPRASSSASLGSSRAKRARCLSPRIPRTSWRSSTRRFPA